MQKFELVLRNEKQKLYDRFAIFIFILNSIGICVVLLYSKARFINTNSKPFFIGLAVALFTYQFFVLFTKTVARFLNSFLIAAFAISLYWALIGYWWAGICTFVLIILYAISKRILKVEIDNEKIRYPSFPPKSIKWNELNNMILKDGLLTIDFRNNKIIQQPINEIQLINEKEFNDFCKQQLNK
jgi:hypothetical protein